MGKRQALCKQSWESWTVACKLTKLELTLTLHTKINSKWPKDLNIREDIIKLLEENTGGKLLDIDLVSNILD